MIWSLIRKKEKGMGRDVADNETLPEEYIIVQEMCLCLEEGGHDTIPDAKNDGVLGCMKKIPIVLVCRKLAGLKAKANVVHQSETSNWQSSTVRARD